MTQPKLADWSGASLDEFGTGDDDAQNDTTNAGDGEAGDDE